MAYALDSGIAVALNNSPTTATYSSGGTSGATSVVIATANSNIKYGQRLTGTGFATNTMVTGVSGTTITFTPAASSQISGVLTFSTIWYKLTDHNRAEIQVNPIVIEKESRVANGKLRKFVVSKKDIISTSWDFLPTTSTEKSPIVDGNYGASWMTAFYNANVNNPIYIKLVASQHTDPSIGQIPNDGTYQSADDTSKIYEVFITGFTKTIRKRTTELDFVDITIEFTEI